MQAVSRKSKLLSLGTTLFFAVAIFYFCYHGISGEKGLLSMLKLKSKVEKAESELKTISHEKAQLQKKVSLLYENSLDLDLLDEQARRSLGYSKKDEVVIFLSKEDKEKLETEN